MIQQFIPQFGQPVYTCPVGMAEEPHLLGNCGGALVVGCAVEALVDAGSSGVYRRGTIIAIHPDGGASVRLCALGRRRRRSPADADLHLAPGLATVLLRAAPAHPDQVAELQMSDGEYATRGSSVDVLQLVGGVPAWVPAVVLATHLGAEPPHVQLAYRAETSSSGRATVSTAPCSDIGATFRSASRALSGGPTRAGQAALAHPQAAVRPRIPSGSGVAVDRHGAVLGVGASVHVAGADGSYRGFVASVAETSVTVRRPHGRNLRDTVEQFDLAAARALITATSPLSPPGGGERRQSGRTRGAHVAVPVDAVGVPLVVGSVVAVLQFVRGEPGPFECTGIVQRVTTEFDPCLITIRYATTSQSLDFAEVRRSVRKLECLPDLCGCGRCTAEDGGGGLCCLASVSHPPRPARPPRPAAGGGGAPVHSPPGGGGIVPQSRQPRPPAAPSDAARGADGGPLSDISRRKARAKHVRRAGRRGRLRDADAVAMALVCNNPPRLSDQPLTDRLRGRQTSRRADLSADDFLMVDFFSGTKSMGMSAQGMYRSWGLCVDVMGAFSPDVEADFTEFDLWGYFLSEFSFIAADGHEYVWIPLHFHLSPSCLTYSCGSGWLSGRFRLSPFADGRATGAAHNADACAVDIASLIRFLRRFGCVSTFTIENPGGSFFWRVLEALLGEDLGTGGEATLGVVGAGPLLTRTVVHYCAYGACFRKPTVIAHSPILGTGWARRCDKSGSCGAMRGGLHGSPGGFTLRDAGIPRALCDSLNLAWRVHHAPLRAQDPLHGALPVETVRTMQREWQRRSRHVRAAAVPVSEDSDASSYESSDSVSSDGSWDDGGELFFTDFDGLAGDAGVVVCEFCSEELSALVGTPDQIGAAAVCPPAAQPASPRGAMCAACHNEAVDGELHVDTGDGPVGVCPYCFLQHFSFGKWEDG